jgi:hypothetical protein
MAEELMTTIESNPTEHGFRTLEQLAATATSLGHVAVHYRPADRELAVRYFQLLGARIREFPNASSPHPLYIIALDGAEPDKANNIVYLFALKPAQADLEAAIGEALGVGTDHEHPAVGAFREHRAQMPESYLHLGVHFTDLGELEAAVQRMQAEMERDPAFGARIQGMQILKARGSDSDTEIAQRMADSPVFGPVDAYAYGVHGVQVHMRTDLFATGVSMFGSVVELDYIFTGPGREKNAFNNLLP